MKNSIATVSLLLEEDGLDQMMTVDNNGKNVVQSAGSVVMQNFLTEVSGG